MLLIIALHEKGGRLAACIPYVGLDWIGLP